MNIASLDSTTKTFRIVLASAHTTNALDITSHYYEVTPPYAIPKTGTFYTNGATEVTVVPAPASGTTTIIKEVSVYNRDTIAHTMYMLIDNNGSKYIIRKYVFNPGETRTFTPPPAAGGVSEEIDPIFSASPAYAIASGDITNWDTAYGWGDHAGLYDTVGTAASEVSGHESTYDHSKLHDPATAGTGISVTGQVIANTDPGSGAVTSHESTYDHSKLHDPATAGTGISVTGQQITNTDTGSAAVTSHNSTFDHTKLHDAATAGTGISVTGQQITNSDTGSAAVTSHNSTYDHTKLHDAVTAGTGISVTGQQVTNSLPSKWTKTSIKLTPATAGNHVEVTADVSTGSIKGISTNYDGLVGVTNKAGYGGVRGTNPLGPGVIGVGLVGVSGQGAGASEIGGAFTNTSAGTALTALTNDSTTDTILEVARISRNSSGTAAAGIGAGLSFYIKDDGAIEYAGKAAVKWTTVTHATRTSSFELSLFNAGTAAVKMAILGTGQMSLPDYGSGTHSGTVAKLLAVTSAGLVIETDGTAAADEKVKYDADDTAPGYLGAKTVAGTGITLAEGTGGDADKLKITNSDTGSAAVTSHNSAYDHTKIHDPATAGTGISVTGQQIANTDTGSAAVTSHNSTYDHTKLHDAVTAGTGISVTGQQVTNSLPSKWTRTGTKLTPSTPGDNVEVTADGVAIKGISNYATGIEGVGNELGTGIGVNGTGFYGGFFTGAAVGALGTSTFGQGVAADNASATVEVISVSKTTAETAIIQPSLVHRLASSGTPANGLGVYDEIQLQSSTTENVSACQVVTKWSTAAHATATSVREWWMKLGGAALAKVMSLDGNGLTVTTATALAKAVYGIAASGYGVYGEGAVGVQGTATTGTGVAGTATGGSGGSFSNTADAVGALFATKSSASTDNIGVMRVVRRNSTGTVAAGFGTQDLYILEDAAGSNIDAAAIDVKWTAATAGATSSQIDWYHRRAGTWEVGMSLLAAGQLVVPGIIGGSGTTQDLTFQTTSGVGEAGADMHFKVGDNGATEAITILNDGKVGINQTTPLTTLDINGTFRIYNPTALSAVGVFGGGTGNDGRALINICRNFTTGTQVGWQLIKNADDHFAFREIDQPTSISAERLTILKGGTIGIGNTSPNANAILDVTSTTKAFMPPRMTTTQRDAISSPTEGMVIYNLTTHVLNFHNGTAWGAV